MNRVDLRVLPLSILVDEAWVTTRGFLRVIFLPLTLALAPVALGVQVLMAWWNLSVIDSTMKSIGQTCGTFAVAGALLLVLFAVYIVLLGTLAVATSWAAAGRPVRLGEALRFYLRPAVWGTDLVAWIVVLAGFVFLVVPGVLIMAAWALRVPVMALEDRTGMASLQRSWQLLSHNPRGRLSTHPVFKAVAVMVLGIVIGYAVGLLIQTPAALVSQWVLFRDIAVGGSPDTRSAFIATLWLTIPSGVLAALAQLAVTCYMNFVIAHLYLDQRRRREGWDLEMALSAIERREP